MMTDVLKTAEQVRGDPGPLVPDPLVPGPGSSLIWSPGEGLQADEMTDGGELLVPPSQINGFVF